MPPALFAVVIFQVESLVFVWASLDYDLSILCFCHQQNHRERSWDVFGNLNQVELNVGGEITSPVFNLTVSKMVHLGLGVGVAQ
jgi:hypothetical protein